jgi:hypothetical protein
MYQKPNFGLVSKYIAIRFKDFGLEIGLLIEQENI